MHRGPKLLTRQNAAAPQERERKKKAAGFFSLFPATPGEQRTGLRGRRRRPSGGRWPGKRMLALCCAAGWPWDGLVPERGVFPCAREHWEVVLLPLLPPAAPGQPGSAAALPSLLLSCADGGFLRVGGPGVRRGGLVWRDPCRFESSPPPSNDDAGHNSQGEAAGPSSEGLPGNGNVEEEGRLLLRW
jgi:hypothetical protein